MGFAAHFTFYLFRVAAVAAAIVFAAACGGSQLKNNWYQNGDIGFRVGHLSPAWKRVGQQRHNDIAWAHQPTGALIQTNASCDPALDIPLQALTHHLLIGFTQVEILQRDNRPLDGREALRSEVKAKLDGVARELVLYVLKKNGCVYDFALIAQQGAGTNLQPEFDQFVQGFTTEKPR